MYLMIVSFLVAEYVSVRDKQMQGDTSGRASHACATKVSIPGQAGDGRCATGALQVHRSARTAASQRGIVG